jgi:predicted DNA-binding protein
MCLHGVMSDPIEPRVRAKKPRRKMGAVANPVLVSWRIELATRNRVNELAKRSGMSASEFVDRMVEHVVLTPQGVPPWVEPYISDGEGVPRRKVGSIESPVLISWRIETSTRERVKELSKRSGMSSSAFVDQLVANLPLTGQGIPSWVPPLDRDGELPIDTV